MQKEFILTLQHNNDQIIGRVKIDEYFLHLFPEFTISPTLLLKEKKENEVINFSLIPTKDYIQGIKMQKAKDEIKKPFLKFAIKVLNYLNKIVSKFTRK